MGGLALSLSWMACGEPTADLPDDPVPAVSTDAGRGDAGGLDSGTPATGEADGGGTDAGEPDAGAVDAGEWDAGEVDAGERDAGEVDAGEPDAGAADSGTTYDAGTPDAGTADAGQSATCSLCHGSAANPAPPTDTSGRTSTSLTTVGAHQAHLRASTWRAPIACSDCHVVPASPTAPGHIDAAPAEVVFSPLATANGTFAASWNGTTCSAYCHGSSMNAGGTNATPEWTSVDAGEVYCGSCHALPPTSGHPQNANCVSCHPQVMNSDNVTFKNPALHINGVKDRQ